MLFVSIVTLDSIQKVPKEVDGIELRLDLLPQFDLELITNIITTSPRPVMFTLRKISQGGLFRGTEKEREALIEQLLLLEPAFFDLEWDMCPSFLERIFQKYDKTHFILSYHNFQETPLNLEEIYQSMSKYPAYGYKIAARSLSTNEALRMLLFARKHSRISVICMGEKGEFARVLGPVVGNLIHYSSLNREEQTAPGQLTVHDLIHLYGYPKLNPNTNLYGLIGDPVSKSLGHFYHNKVFEERQLNSVYVKMNVTPDELSTFFSLAREIGFQGLSVTMPLKEKVLPFLNVIDPEAQRIGAVNTLVFKNGQILGLNTDGIGALNAIEKRMPVYGKKIVLLGAGGAARAIAFEAFKRGANILILNRTIQKALELAHELGCEAGGLLDVPLEYEILINCSSDSMPIDPEKILSSALIMDVVYVPRETPLLLKALSLGCQMVYGDEMFFNQAAAQSELWI
jgi:3-dehydroquinate dehydratase / shikimate dehydrogenase